jgi:choline-sulfatase
MASGNVPFQAVDLLDGASFTPLLTGKSRADALNTFAAEFTGEGAIAPMVAVRKGNYKLIMSLADSPQLFDLGTDPLELTNLAGRAEVSAIQIDLENEVSKRWNLKQINTDVLGSQKRRRWVQDQLNSVESKPWDFQPFTDASKQFVRGGKNSSPTAVKGRARFPFVSPKAPDTPRQTS